MTSCLGRNATVVAEDLTTTWSASTVAANLRTQTVTRKLGQEAKAEFLTRVENRIRRLGWPKLTATFVGLLTVGRLRKPAVTRTGGA